MGKGGDIADKKKVLVVAAHGDDEVLGCGGTMARHVAKGDEVRVIFMADGVTSREGSVHSETSLEERNSAMSKALEILGVSRHDCLGLPDNRMDQPDFLDVVHRLEPLLFDYAPDVIYTHHGGDLNIDHRLTLQAVLTICRPQPQGLRPNIFSFEVLSSTNWTSPGVGFAFEPNFFVDISTHLDAKQHALAAYAEEMRPFPHSRSAEACVALAHYRGATMGVPAAEAFVVERQLWQ